MSAPNIPSPRFGVFLEDSGSVAGTIDLQDKLRIGEFNTERVRELSVEDFIKRGSPEFSGLSPARRLKKLEELFARGAVVKGARPNIGAEVRKAAVDAETDQRLAIECERLGRDFQALHRDWESYYSDLEKAGQETPELKRREVRLESRTAELHRRSEALGRRQARESLVRGLEELLGVDFDNRSLRILEVTPATLWVGAADAAVKGVFHFAQIHPSERSSGCAALRESASGGEQGGPSREISVEPEIFLEMKDAARRLR